MKSMMLATASAVMFASAASAGEPVRLNDSQLDGVTAAFRLAVGAVLGGAANGGLGASRFASKNLNKVDSKVSVTATQQTASDLVWSEQTVDAAANGDAGSISLGLSVGAAVFVP